jgi:hypothetical protein
MYEFGHNYKTFDGIMQSLFSQWIYDWKFERMPFNNYTNYWVETEIRDFIYLIKLNLTIAIFLNLKLVRLMRE